MQAAVAVRLRVLQVQVVLLAARDAGVRRVVSASSSSVYGANAELPKREDMPALPMAPYAVSKLAGEGYCRSFNRVYGMDTVALRYFNVFGPRQDPNSQYSAVIPNFINAYLDDRSPVVHGDGEQSRDFTYIDNIVDANLLAARAGPEAAGETFNIACGDRISLNQILEAIAEQAGKRIEATHTDSRPGDIPHSQADIGKASEVLGFVPAVSTPDGLRMTYAYYEAERDGVALK